MILLPRYLTSTEWSYLFLLLLLRAAAGLNFSVCHAIHARRSCFLGNEEAAIFYSGEEEDEELDESPSRRQVVRRSYSAVFL